MQLLDMRLGNLVCGMVDDIIDATEVVDGLHDVINARVLRGDAQGVGLKDIACLLLGQAAAFDMVGVVGQVNLYAMINAAFHLGFLLFAQCGKQGRHLFLVSSGQFGINGNVPCLSREESTFDFPCGAIVSGCALTDAVFFGKLTD